MADDTIREHDPFSGHDDPVPVEDPAEPEVETPPAAETPEPPKKPVRRGRRPRRTPSAAEVEASRKRVR
jgi:hypothetical protein